MQPFANAVRLLRAAFAHVQKREDLLMILTVNPRSSRVTRYALTALAFLAATMIARAEEAYDPSKPAAPVAEPSDYRMEEFRKPVPATLKGAKVVTSEEAAALWASKAAIFFSRSVRSR